ncbi:MAG: nucleotidyltransferase domain-containing protein [Tannerella sp.]|nr:nucleotidyltransferase domain-containing protein [Tannerella sp.]
MEQTANLSADLKRYFRSERRVSHAWTFGSFARGDSRPDSDIDIMVEMKTDKRYTLYDLFDIQHQLEKLLCRKIDLVEKDFVKPAAWASVRQDLTLIV